MALAPNETQRIMLSAVARLMDRFPPDYWKGLEDSEAYPEAFVAEFEAQGFGGLLIPTEYGGAGGSLSDAALLLEEIHARGGNAQPFHGQFYLSFLVSRFASEGIRRKVLPDLAQGKLRMQSFALTEPDAGSDLTRITTFAEREGDRYRIRGRKVWTSKALESERVLLLCRTTPLEECAKRTDGMTLFLASLRDPAVTITPIPKAGRNAVASCEVVYDDLQVDEADRVGEEGRGFRYLVDGLNAERILIASEALGIGRAALRRAVAYAKERVVFGRPIGQNQAVAFPLAEIHARLRAAERTADNR